MGLPSSRSNAGQSVISQHLSGPGGCSRWGGPRSGGAGDDSDGDRASADLGNSGYCSLGKHDITPLPHQKNSVDPPINAPNSSPISPDDESMRAYIARQKEIRHEMAVQSRDWLREAGLNERSLLLCGSSPIYDQMAAIKAYSDGTVRQQSIMHCHSKWSCPECSGFELWKSTQDIKALLMALARANNDYFLNKRRVEYLACSISTLEELQRNGDITPDKQRILLGYKKEYEERSKLNLPVYTCVLQTLTAPHKPGDDLRTQMKDFSRAYSGMLDSSPIRKLKKKYNYVGNIRCYDHTVRAVLVDPKDGIELPDWHTHFHNLWIFQCDFSENSDAMREIEEVFESQWQKFHSLVFSSFKSVNVEHGINHEIVTLSESEELASYVAKMVSTYVTKNEKNESGVYAPFDLLSGPLETEEFRKHAWVNYVVSVKGFKRINWSCGLKKAFSQVLWHKNDEQTMAAYEEAQLSLHPEFSTLLGKTLKNGRVLDLVVYPSKYTLGILANNPPLRASLYREMSKHNVDGVCRILKHCKRPRDTHNPHAPDQDWSGPVVEDYDFVEDIKAKRENPLSEDSWIELYKDDDDIPALFDRYEYKPKGFSGILANKDGVTFPKMELVEPDDDEYTCYDIDDELGNDDLDLEPKDIFGEYYRLPDGTYVPLDLWIERISSFSSAVTAEMYPAPGAIAEEDLPYWDCW